MSIFLPNLCSANARFRSIEIPIEYGQLLVRSVIQNNQGLILLGTESGVFQYDGYKVSPFVMMTDTNELDQKTSVSHLLSDKLGALWVANRGSGLFRYLHGELIHFSNNSAADHYIDSDFVSETLMDEENTLWLATEQGLHAIDAQMHVTQYKNNAVDNPRWQFMTALLSLNKQELLIGTKAGLLVFNRHKLAFNKINLLAEDQETVIYALHQDHLGGVWVGSDDGIFYRPFGNNQFTHFQTDTIPNKILSITSSGDDVWFGSISNGLFQYSLSNQSMEHHKYQRQNKDSLSDNTIVDLFVDASGVLWVSTFYQGVNNLDIQSLHFGLENDSTDSVSCADNLLFSGFAEDAAGDLWMANGTALIQYNPVKNKCVRHDFMHGSHTIKSVLFDSQDQLWLASTKGLFSFDRQHESFISATDEGEQALTNFVIETTPGNLLLGTVEGLYAYDTASKKMSGIYFEVEGSDVIKLYGHALNSFGQLYFATNAGVMYLTSEGLFSAVNIQKQLATDAILQVFYDDLGQLWVGTDGQGIYVFDKNEVLLFHESYFGDIKQDSIKSITQALNGDIWMGSDSGLIRINTNDFTFKVFYPSDGVQGISFNINAAYRGQDGRLYMGGLNGFNAFEPSMILTQADMPKIAITDFTRFGKSVATSYSAKNGHQGLDEFVLSEPINELQDLTLSHKDYVIGFEFAVLDYSDPKRNQYAFKMQGLDPSWNYVDAENRRISYSNLSPGAYVFRVKGANKHGIWNDKGKSINITVLPAPWLTWWAITAYVITIMVLVIWLLERKMRINNRINLRLKSEVAMQTKALKFEKKTVEDLLAKKNQLFANVSHEFRTPLTLILGPLKRLLKTPLNSEQSQTLKIINRNANRLLTMIEQLLHLAKMSGKHTIDFHNTATHLTIEAMVNAFQTLAVNKRITLELLRNDSAIVKFSQDGLDVILSNLISNAIKYTPEGGQVEIESCLQGTSLCILVKDTGAGLNAEQQLLIFDRFKRLDRDQNIEGIGIGLSVVKELVELNNGTITLASEPGKGSCFSVIFTVADSQEQVDDNLSGVLLVKQLSQIEEQQANVTEMAEWEDNDHKEKVLIIDDNTDMRNHIADSLKNHYQCLLASGGKEGIALAIQYVPDVVICDVMMPEMDGFHVSRVLRSDARTSHIPLVLLTALDDKESRVRGWREHVDVYLTKPFDASELLLQLENILVIRSILNKKAGVNVKAGQQTGLIDLPKKDRQFISKLNQIIVNNYQDPNYSREQMASTMAVSERQLQRKLKALIDKNPIDLLREYRLSQAAIMLKDGYQVSITSDACGFNSLPHFSKCFKSQFGLPPKAYQSACK